MIDQPINLGSHDEIVLVQTFDLLRLQGHLRVAPPEADIGVMPFGLGEFADFLHEAERLAEVLKPERVLDLAGLVAYLPLWNLRMKALGLFRR